MKPLRLFGSSPTIWLTLEKLLQQIMWLVLFLILAPILGPKPYGLFAIVMAFIGFCELIIVGATVEALVTVPDTTDAHLRTANLVTILAAGAAAVVAFGAASPIAQLFDSPELAPLFRALAPLPLISAFTASPTAVLMRQMRFRAFALRSTVGLLAGGAVAVVLALSGSGVWALVLQILVQRSIELVLLWSSARTPLRLNWSQQHYRDFRGYAASIGISKAMAWSGSQIPRIILGWYLGPADLGLFALAGRIMDFIVQVFVVPQAWISRLALREFAEEPAIFAREFQLVIRQIAIITFPACTGLAAMMPVLFDKYLDPRWTAGTLAAQLLILTGIPATFYYCFTAAVLAARKPHLDSHVAIAINSTTALAVLVAGAYGLNAACAAMLVQRFVLMPAPLIMLRRAIGISPMAVILWQLPILAAALAMGWAVIMMTPTVKTMVGLTFAPVILVSAGVAIYSPLALLVAPDIVRLLWKRMLSIVAPRLGQA